MYFHIFSSVLPLPPRRTRARWTGRVCSTRSPSSGSTRSCPPGTSAASRNPSPVSVNILELETKVAEDSAKFYMVVKSSGTFGKPSFEALLATFIGSGWTQVTEKCQINNLDAGEVGTNACNSDQFNTGTGIFTTPFRGRVI